MAPALDTETLPLISNFKFQINGGGVMYVLMISPGYPQEIPYFTRALAWAGARVLGVSDQPESALPTEARANLAGYLQVKSLWDEDDVVEAVRSEERRVGKECRSR